MNDSRPILLVEDDDVDAMTVKRALNELHTTNLLVRLTNGEEALDYLRDPSNDKPCIILLDLNMPRMGGVEFLQIAKKEAALMIIPVIVLTTSGSDRDIVESFDLSVAGYMLKPVDYEHFLETVRTIQLYWELNLLPV